ncbi:MAG: LLM class flavin-dependent oxidoreductase, partial [Actinomycetota bacterium]
MINLGAVGVWTFAFDQMPIGAVRDTAAEIEALGYGAIWIGEAVGRESLTHAALLCAATERIVVASGIARVGERSPRVMHAAANALAEASGGRYLLGLGGSNQLDGDLGAVAAMAGYLDQYHAAPYIAPLANEPPPVILGAQGPAMLRLAAERTQGTHTFLVTPEHTAWARDVLGPRPILAVEQAVITETDPTIARKLARDHLAFYLQLPHFQANLASAGFEACAWANG